MVPGPMIQRMKRNFLKKYMGSSALTFRRAGALLYVHLLFLLFSLLFVVSMAFVQGFTTNVVAVIILSILLCINLLIIRQGAFSTGVLTALLVAIAMLSSTVYLAGNRSHMSLYNLGFFQVFVLLLAGLISQRKWDSIVLGAVSVLLTFHYFFFEIFPSEQLPLTFYIHDYVAVNFVIIISTFIAAYINYQINRLFGDLERINVSLEQTVTERTDALVESEKLAALGSMVGGISHEINTPVGNSVTIISHLHREFEDVTRRLDEGSLSKSRMTDFLEVGMEAVTAAERNLDIAASLVTSFKKIAAELHYDMPVEQNIREEMDMIVGSMQSIFKKADGVEVVILGDKDISLPMYPGVLWHVLTNLINNSLTHGLSEQPGTIRLSYGIRGRALYVEYEDDGRGMDEQTLKQHLEPFFTTRRGQGGTGLGMSIVHNILLKIGAHIRAESSLGQGVRYRIDFPPIA